MIIIQKEELNQSDRNIYCLFKISDISNGTITFEVINSGNFYNYKDFTTEKMRDYQKGETFKFLYKLFKFEDISINLVGEYYLKKDEYSYY